MRRLLRRLRRRFQLVLRRDPVQGARDEVAPAAPSPQPPQNEAQPPDPVDEAPISAAAASAVLRRTVRALRPPVDRLQEAERQRLGGLIFFGAVHFVSRVSQILGERPTLSPDPARIHAAGLAARQQRATRWALVHAALARLTELANDCYLHEQGSAVEEAKMVVEAHELAMAQALVQGGPDERLLEDAMYIARIQVVLRRGQKRRREAQRRGERRLKEARERPGERQGARSKGTRDRARRAEAEPLVDVMAWGRAASRREEPR